MKSAEGCEFKSRQTLECCSDELSEVAGAGCWFGWLCNWLNIHEAVSNSVTLEVPHYFHSNLVYMKMFENFTVKMFSLFDSHQ